MPAFPVLAPTSASNLDLGRIDGNEFNIEPVNKEVQLTPCNFAATSFQHNSGFQGIWCR